ncbi:MAG: protein kinase [Gemmatimonadales bacterium]|nr:MAG: protein kinase [Gemmatimonadales bacterium]
MNGLEALTAALADRYRIERQLGQGGMATVYLAEDLRHARQVAIKVLKPELAAMVGGERFLAEIRTTANLQHPHILPLFDSGEADGFLFYVMPYLKGESLRARLDREKQLPVEEAVEIAVKVAGALQAAHDRGIVHRDIKPANILLGERGEPLVADFGIALAVQEAGGGRLTETGLSLGTPYYMSPEQATGDRDPDARSDVYSVACVLYEMLAGDPPHTGSTAQAVMAKILTRDPEPVTESRASVPTHVAWALGRALQRLPADRFPSAADFSAALQGRMASAPGPLGVGPVGARSTRGWVWPAVATALGILTVWGWMRPPGDPPEAVPSHLAVPLPNLGGAATAQDRQLALSPDGSTLLFTAIAPDGENRTMRRRLHETEATVLPGVKPFLAGYIVSPDGREFLGYDTDWRLYRYSMDGGNERAIPGSAVSPQWAVWASDGNLWFSSDVTDAGLVRVDASGAVTRPLGERVVSTTIQDILPDARFALTIRQPRGISSGPVRLLDLQTGEMGEILIAADVVAVVYTAGHLVYALANGDLETVAFDPVKRTLLGEPVQIAEGVMVEAGNAQLTASDNGTVAYIPEEPRILQLVDRDGRTRPVTRDNHNFHGPAFSPDGRRLAVDFTSDQGRNVWTLSLDEGVLTRATFDRNGHDARWTPDGRFVTYLAEPELGGQFGIYRTRPGSLDSDSLITVPGVSFTGIWLRDESALVTTADGLSPGSGPDIALIGNGGRGPVEPLVATRFSEGWPAVSPDDRWLAFTSDRSGQFEVYVQPLAGDGGLFQVSVDGGIEPLWSADGRELFYRTGAGAGSELVAAVIATDPEPSVVSRETLFSMADAATATPHVNYDVSPDGQTFAVVRFNPSSRIMVIQNLPELVRELAGGGSR